MFEEFKPAEVKGYGTRNVEIPEALLKRIYFDTTGKQLVGKTFDEAFEKEDTAGGDIPVYRKFNTRHAEAKALHVKAQKKLVHRITHEAKSDNFELRRTLIAELIAREMLRNFHTECINRHGKTIKNIIHSRNLSRDPNYDAIRITQDHVGRKSINIDYGKLPIENRIPAFGDLAKAYEDRVEASKAAVEPEKELDDMVRKNPKLTTSELSKRYKNFSKYQDSLDVANATFRAATKRIKAAQKKIVSKLNLEKHVSALTHISVEGFDATLPKLEPKIPGLPILDTLGKKAKPPLRIRLGHSAKRKK